MHTHGLQVQISFKKDSSGILKIINETSSKMEPFDV